MHQQLNLALEHQRAVNAGVGSDDHARVALLGGEPDLARLGVMNAAAHVRPDAPPFFLAQGDQDSYSPRSVETARGFARDLGRVSYAPVVYAELPGGQHAFDVFRSVRFEAVVDGIEAFAARALRARAGAGRA